MEGGAQAPDWDSDETVIDGSVTESDLDDEELPWRRVFGTKELNTDRDSPEISFLSGTTTKVSDVVVVKEKPLLEPEKILAVPNNFSESGKEATLTMNSEETKDEESSLKTFVSALERLLTSPEITQEERLLEIMSDFEPKELANPLSNSPSSISVSLTCHKDLLENTKDDALPTELLAVLNTLSEGDVGPVCHGEEGGSSLRAGNEYSGVEPKKSQTTEDCTQIAETLEDPSLSGLQTLVHQSVTSCDPLNNKGNSNSVENKSDEDPPCVLRRSSRLRAGRNEKHTDDKYKMPKKILPKILVSENQTNNNSSTKNFRMQDPALMIKGKGKNMHSTRLKSGEQMQRNKKFAGKNEKMKRNKVSLSSINRRNIFGENLLYQAALHNDIDLVHHYIMKGGNVNQPSYAGWTALHEASVGGFYQTASELLKGGADVNIKGMYQITPLHDAVINGHYKVAELLLLNGADPLLRSDGGKCPLDEAKDSCMKRLLEKYIPKHQKPAQKNSTDPLDIEDAHQHKKPKFSSKNLIGFVCNENSNRQKSELEKVDKESKGGLFINKEDVYEPYQKDSKDTKFGKSKHKQSTLNQIHSTRGLRKKSLQNVKGPNTNVSNDKGRRNTQHKRTQVDDAKQEIHIPRKIIPLSSVRRRNRLVNGQQDNLQAFDDLPEKSHKLFSPPLSSLKNGLGNNIEACSIPRETHTQSLDLSDNQEIKFSESTDQEEAVLFSGLSLQKEIKLPLVTTDQQSHTHQEQQHISPDKSPENSNSGQKGESLHKWEHSFASFIKENFNNDEDDCFTSEKTIACKRPVCFTGCKNHCSYNENITNREEMDFHQFFPSENHFSQENELKAYSLIILPQQEAVNLSDSDNTIGPEQHIANYEQCACETSFDHSHGNPEHTSLACPRTFSTQEASKLTSHVKLFKRSQDFSSRAPTPLMDQTDTHIVEKVNEGEDTKRNYNDESQKTSSSNRPSSTVVNSQVIETTTVKKRKQDLPESKTIHDIVFYSTDNTSKELANISQLRQKEEKEISHKPEVKTAGINKRNARGESQLHLAARRGNLTLVKALIESGADVNLKDNAGWTPLHEASSEGSNDIIVELLKAGANVNCENLDGINPLHDAAANDHLKAAEILLQHGANPNQKNQKQKTALDEADNEKMKELLKSYGAIETDNRDESNVIATVKIPAVRPKRLKRCFCDDCKTVDPPSLSHREKTRESHPVHQTISAILQDIEEKQENLLEFEIRTPEDAEQYIEKMLEIKEIMDNVLAKQKAERDDLAKKYRVSVESFKQGVLREQLANLATRQKNLLVVAKKQKKISQKIQNYKNITSLSGPSLRNLPSSSEITSEKESQELTSLENSLQPQSGSLSPIGRICGSMQETQLSLDMWNGSQNTNTCVNSETVRREEFSGNELNSKQNVNDCTLDGLSKSRHSDGSKKIKLPSQPVAFITQEEHSQKENDLIETPAKGHKSYSSPSAVTSTLNISETTSILAENDAHPSTFICDQAPTSCDPKRRKRKIASQQQPRGTLESLAHQGTDALGSSSTGYQTKSYLKKSAFAVPHASDSQNSSSSGCGCQRTIRKPLNYSTRKKCMQIKDLILLGRINPGNNILEFKTQ
ncbi:hypothetical protein GH733_009804, partial [Mirounga leonina]